MWDLGACSNQKRLHTFTISICKESNEWLLITDCMYQQHHHKRIFKSLFSIMEIQNPKRKGYTYPPSSWISDNWGRRTGTPLSVCLLRQIGNCIWKAHRAQVRIYDFHDAYSSVLTCQHLANVLFDIDWTHSIKCRDNRLKLRPYVGLVFIQCCSLTLVKQCEKNVGVWIWRVCHKSKQIEWSRLT